MEPHLAERYGELERWHWWFRGRQQILETVLRRELRGRQGVCVVSLGAGPAEGLRWLLPIAGAGGRVVGVDLAANHCGAPWQGVNYVVGSSEAVPLASTSFDVVLALDVLEHLDDDVAAVREASWLLKPGGLLLVTVPAMPSLWGAQDVVSHHRRRYTRATLYQTFARAGLPRPSVSFFNTLLFPIVAGVRWTRSALGWTGADRSDFDDNTPGVANALLARIFAAERHLVGRIPLPFGVSLLATLWR